MWKEEKWDNLKVNERRKTFFFPVAAPELASPFQMRPTL
jgi:hypothetical protein